MPWTMGGSDGSDSAGDGLPAGGPLNSPIPVSIVCIGAGVSGIATAIRVQETMKNYDFTIFEKNHDLGGTWLENRW
jgi:heterodisulfide reductase subunit A-like polyferredoxin